METINRPNKDALTKAVDIYRDAMRAFIIRQLKQVQGRQVEEMISGSLLSERAVNFKAALQEGKKAVDFIDTTDFPKIINRRWNEAFSRYFNGDRGVQDLANLIHTNARNAAAHPPSTDFEEEKTLSALQYIIDALGRINAPQDKAKVETIRDSLKQPKNEPTESKIEKPEGKDESEEIKPPVPIKRKTGNLTPWREAIDLNPDVKKESGQAEYRADLQQVYKEEADPIYSNPSQFFKRTYISAGLRALLMNSLKRWNGKGGDPVVQTKIGFGGGKTHSLIALRHLARRPDELLKHGESNNPALARMTREIREIVEAAGLNPDETPGECKVAVLAGTSLSTTSKAKTDKGDPLNTLWGEMAYQLADQRGYEIVGEAARKGLAPGGDELDALFKNVGSFVILMDEIVAYTRNLPDEQTEDRIYTFIQNLTEAVHRSKRGVLVVTLPSSAEEAGSETRAQAILDRIEHILSRIKAANEVLEIKESYEVVRRRLFEEVKDEAARDQTCEAFAKMYRNSSKSYPPRSRDPKYLELMKACYPIHPEVFERLYEDWSAYPRFQRTRGVLRLMAACVHRLQNSDDPLIMPGDLPMDESNVKEELERCLGGNWDPVFSEVDGPDARVKEIDATTKRFRETGAAQRIARTTLLGSAQASARHGIDLRQIHLGVVKPGDGVNVYSDALKQMKEKLYYLYAQGGMHFFHVEPNLVRVAQDRVDKLTTEQLDAHIVQKLNEATRRHQGVAVCPDETFMTDDQNKVTLAVLSPSESIPSRAAENDTATEAARRILTTRGDGSPRSFRNMIVFLAAKNDAIRELRRSAAQYLAWDSIVNGNEHAEKVPGLKEDRLKEAKSRIKDNKEKTADALIRAYQHALYPRQPDDTKTEYEIIQVQTDADGDIVEAAFNKLIAEEEIAEDMSAGSLERFLEEYVWSREETKDHIDIDKLWGLFAQFVYMPRLKSKSILVSAVAASVEGGLLGSADDYDEESGTYENLQYEKKLWMVNDLRGLIVRKDAALLQHDLEREDAAEQRAEAERRRKEEEAQSEKRLDPPKLPKLFTITKQTNLESLKQSMADIENEIMPSLHSGEVSVRIIVTAKHARGFDENDARAVRENCKELGIELDEESDL